MLSKNFKIFKGKTGKDVIKLMVDSKLDPFQIVKTHGWLRITDISQLRSLCDELVSKSPEKVSIAQSIYIYNY